MKSQFSKKIQKMIISRMNKGKSARVITQEINNSATAEQLQIQYSTRQIAAKMGWINLNNKPQ